jgi:hypothetical protein
LALTIFKVGHFTMDNASNNVTMMEKLSLLLVARDIAFDEFDRRIMCFGHVVDLTSGRVIKESSEKKNKATLPVPPQSLRDPINLARNVVRVIRASGARRDAFDAVIENGNKKHLFKQGRPPKVVTLNKLQLLRSVPTRWDSVYLMLRRLRELQPVSPSFFDSSFMLLILPN